MLIRWAGYLLILTLAACIPAEPAVYQPDTTAALSTIVALPPTKTAALQTATPQAVITPMATPSPPLMTSNPPPEVTPLICSPLKDFDFEQLEAAIFNPYAPPRPGSDDPHQGVDFAIQPENLGYAVEGHLVQAVLPGKIAAVIRDRFPYGNAILVETPLDELPTDWDGLLSIQETQGELPPPALTCPETPNPTWDSERRSLYALYVHLQGEPSFSPGDAVSCGETLEAIGSSGNALNPHLHLEIRIGPGGARFGGMAHYDASASNEEMSNYCTWRVLGSFNHIDPLLLLRMLE